MFIPAPELTHVAAPHERIVAVIESINTPNVVIPGREAEPTRAFIVGVRNPDGSFSLFIYLHQIESNQPAIYVSEPRSVTLSQYPEVEGDAINFVESMGFMLDNVNFRRLQPSQQAAVIERIPAFHADRARFAREPAATTARPSAPSKSPEPEAAPVSPAPLLDGLESLEPVESFTSLDVLEPLDPVASGAELLPVATVEHSGLMELSDEERAEIDGSFASSTAGALPALNADERERLMRLLIAF